MSYNYYLQEQLAKAHYQELVCEANQHRQLVQLRGPRSSHERLLIAGLVLLGLAVGLVFVSVTLLPGLASAALPGHGFLLCGLWPLRSL